jgi:hypothetical protein
MGPPLKQDQDRGHVAAPKVLSSHTPEVVPSSKASHVSSQTPSLAKPSVGNAAETKATAKQVSETRTRETRTKEVRRLRVVARSDVTQSETETRTKEVSAARLLVVAQSANEHEAKKEVAERHHAEVAEHVEGAASPPAQVSMCVCVRERESV